MEFGDDVIADVIDRWHRHLRGDLPGGLDELLHEDVVFYSPIVYTPQEGREITKLYLTAAGQTLPGAAVEESGDGSGRIVGELPLHEAACSAATPPSSSSRRLSAAST